MHLNLLPVLSILPSLTAAVQITYTPFISELDCGTPSALNLTIDPTLPDSSNKTTISYTLTPFRALPDPTLNKTFMQLQCWISTNITFSEPGWQIFVNGWVGGVKGNLPLAEGERGSVMAGWEWVSGNGGHMGDSYVSCLFGF